MTSEEALLSCELPKWPKMYVTGNPVTIAQAKEIIRRTDTFFTHGYSGNNHEYNRWVRKRLKMPMDWLDLPSGLSQEERIKQSRKLQTEQTKFRKRWNVLSTNYVHNSWISCAFIGGPHGWCHPDGTIGFEDNVGKWPAPITVYEDWKLLAKEFPFVDVGVTLFSAENIEPDCLPVVSFSVKNGRVAVVDPATNNVHASHPKGFRRAGAAGNAMLVFMGGFGSTSREQGLPDSWIEEWALQHTKAKPKRQPK